MSVSLVGRAKKKGGRRKKRIDSDSDNELMDVDEPAPGVVTTVAWQTVDAYIAAMVDLWETQKRALVTANSHPRKGPVAEIMTTLRRNVAAKKRAE